MRIQNSRGCEMGGYEMGGYEMGATTREGFAQRVVP